MTRLTAILVVLASFLLVAPVIESGTQTAAPIFQAVATPRTVRATRAQAGESDLAQSTNQHHKEETSP